VPVRLRIDRAAGAEASLRTHIKRRAVAMLSALQLEKAELSLVLSGDDQIHQLNKLYRGKDRPTDVLAFAMREGDFGRFHETLPSRLLGDVIISVPTATRQAKVAKHAVLAEITMLLAHGLLHLLGWDHETKAKDTAMRAETQKLVDVAVAGDPGRAPARKKPPTRPTQKTQRGRG
jgi:probable rRNA maturation factor